MFSLDKDRVLEIAEREDVRFILLWFTDVLGNLRGLTVPRSELEYALDDGIGFDGSSVLGYTSIEDSDLIAFPDPRTFAPMPIEDGVARMFCDVMRPDGEPFEGDPRYALKRSLNHLQERGMTFYVGPELEYFNLLSSGNPEITDQASYFDVIRDAGETMKQETMRVLHSMGIQSEYAHHEVSPSQHEIVFRYSDALIMAENVITYRFLIKAIARRHGCYVTFMPKISETLNGNGMHVHQSIFYGDRNAFFDPDDDYNLSSLARSYIAGLLVHVREITAVTNQWVNSYKRLVPGYEAPVYITWARSNRSALIRVPWYNPEKETAARLELRSPDPACNPYLAFAVMLAAGMNGVDGRYDLPPPVERDVYRMSEEERREQGIEVLPETLKQALDLARESELVRGVLGEYMTDRFMEIKYREWERFRSYVTNWEITEYLPLL